MSWLESFSHVQRNCDGKRSDWLCRCWNVVDPRLMSTSVSPGDGNGARPTDPASIITVPAEKKLDPTLDFLAGTAAGISGLVVGFPFDTGGPSFVFFLPFLLRLTIRHQVKYRFQNPSPNARYRSTLHALVTITREERLHGLFRGISSPLVRRVVRRRHLCAPSPSPRAERNRGPHPSPP